LTTTVLRILRQIRGESLDAIGSKLGFQKSTLSTAERYPESAGPRLRKSLERHYDAQWKVLAASLTRETLSSALLKTLTKE
jgi:hypothetical protein